MCLTTRTGYHIEYHRSDFHEEHYNYSVVEHVTYMLPQLESRPLSPPGKLVESTYCHCNKDVDQYCRTLGLYSVTQHHTNIAWPASKPESVGLESKCELAPRPLDSLLRLVMSEPSTLRPQTRVLLADTSGSLYLDDAWEIPREQRIVS